MENKIQVFSNKEFGQLEVLMIDGKPHFPAKECAEILGYKNPYDAISKHCKRDGVAKREGVSETTNQHGKTTLQQVERVYISEGNLYRLITRSKLPEAEKFERFVFDEVMPTIRKTGAYVTDELLTKLANNEEERSALFDTLIKERKERREEQMLFNRRFENNEKIFAAIRSECEELLEENSDLRDENELLEDCIGELLPSADYCDTILQCKDALPISIIASSYGMSAVVFNRLLRELKIQRKVRGVWILYSRFQSKGYTALRTCSAGKEKSVTFTCWTQRGRKFIYDTLKQHGLVPQIERMYENLI